MGATGWAYFVSYQEDIDKALQELRKEVFQEGAYWKIADHNPETIEDLIEAQGEAGTHSIIDIDQVAETPGYREIGSLWEEELMELFGTIEPTRSMVEDKAEEMMSIPDRWEGIYFVVYKDGLPNEICFAGWSGD